MGHSGWSRTRITFIEAIIQSYFRYTQGQRMAIKMTTLQDGLNLLGHIGNNAVNLELLLQHLDRLVPFVGAGLSSDFGYPSWNKLLQGLATQDGLRAQIDDLLAQHQF